MPLKSLARTVTGKAIQWCGIGKLYEAVARPDGAIILMYHSVASDEVAPALNLRTRISPALFASQMEYLSKHRKVISLSQLVDQIKSGASPTAGTVCITFDDGYLDNLTIAAPILAEYGLPATLYLATGYVERSESQWVDRLHWLITQRTRDALQIEGLNNGKTVLAASHAFATAMEQLHHRLLEASAEERKALLDEMEIQLKPEGKPPRLTLNWDEVRDLCRRYPQFEIGGHTREHVDLQKYTGATAHAEIGGCAEDIRRELSQQPQHFSFPYGRWCTDTRQDVIASGWQSAVGVNTPLRVGGESDRYAIPRIEAPQSMSDLQFKTSGAYPGVFTALGLQ